MQITKSSENEIKVVKTETKTETTENFYSFEFLTEQRTRIQAQKDRDNAQRDAELAEVDALLAECDKLGIQAINLNEKVI